MRRVESTARTALVLPLVATLAACASLGAPRPAPDYATSLDEADAALTLGRTDLAVSALERAAQADPTRKDPWLRLAALHAQAERPGAAAQAAEEVLRRDPADADARALLLNSSLRLATATLSRARREKWAAAPRADLDRLVHAVRATVGTDALVPEAVREELATLRARAEKAPKCMPPKDAKPAGDPFRALGADEPAPEKGEKKDK